MSTSINFRINEELEKRLKEKIKELKSNSPIGTEVSNSSVARGALIDLFNRIDKGIYNSVSLYFDIKNMSDSKLRKLQSVITQLQDLFKDEMGKSESVVKGIDVLRTEIALEQIKRHKLSIEGGN